MKTGKMLHIDLSSEVIETRVIPDNLTTRFLGGRGLATALSHHFIAGGCDPLGPQNTLSICTGLLTGTAAPSAARTHFCGLSPLTGLLGSSNAGGFFGAALRACGLQGLVISGAAAGPVYLFIGPTGARIRPADHLWGLDTRRCEDQLKHELGERRLRVLSIGPAGENRSAMACIMLDTHSAAGRTGLGAVMGAKLLKAIVVHGTRPAEHAAGIIKEARAAYLDPLLKSEMFQVLHTHGQSGYVRWCNRMGMLSTRNYQSGVFAKARRICGSNYNGRVNRHRACFGCPIRCKADTMIPAGPYAGESGPRPEFETIAALGAKCGQRDTDAVLHLAYLCGRLGLDTISAGSTLAFAMELFEKGILTAADTGGLALHWGDVRVQEQLLQQISARKGLGAVLADGVRAAAQRIGPVSEPFAFHSKGLELCAYDPRGSLGTALSCAVSGRGGDYGFNFAGAEFRWDARTAEKNIGDARGADRFSPIGKAAMVRRCSICSAVVDSLGLCKVAALGISAAFDLKAEADLLNAVMGWQVTPDDLFRVGERILTLERLFNLRHWTGRGDLDALPRRFINRSLKRGPARNRRVDLAPMLAEYYSAMGWDGEGRPTSEKLRQLELESGGMDWPVKPDQPGGPVMHQ